MNAKLTVVGLEVAAFLAVFFSPIIGALVAIGMLIAIDTFTGIWAAHKRGEKINSKKSRAIVPKLILYPTALIVAEIAREFLAPAIPWTDVTGGVLATIEVKSIFENMSDILGYNLWKKVKDSLTKTTIDAGKGKE